jgi:hypothetical protein
LAIPFRLNALRAAQVVGDLPTGSAGNTLIPNTCQLANYPYICRLKKKIEEDE